MMKQITAKMLPFFILAALLACSAKDGGKDVGTSARLELYKHGVTLDARYDPRLDNLIPGYKILTVAVTNNSVDIMRLNPLKDKWEITDAMGRKRKAINSIRIKEPALFTRLPNKVQELIDYPVGISVGYSETIDLFFPQSVDLNAFRTISFYNSSMDMTFDMLSNLDSPNSVPVNSSAKAPNQETDVRFKKR